MPSSITFVNPQATRGLRPMTMPGDPATLAPAASMPGACRWQRYQTAGRPRPRWGSLARSGLPSALSRHGPVVADRSGGHGEDPCPERLRVPGLGHRPVHREHSGMQRPDAELREGVEVGIRGEALARRGREQVVPLPQGEVLPLHQREELRRQGRERQVPGEVDQEADLVFAGPGLGRESHRPELEGQIASPAGQVRVHPLGVRFGDRALGLGEGGGSPAPHAGKAEHPGEHVRADRRLAGDLGEPPAGEAAQALHLPEPVLRVDEALGREEIVVVLRENVRDAPAVAEHFDPAAEGEPANRTARLRIGLADEEAREPAELPTCNPINVFHGAILPQTSALCISAEADGRAPRARPLPWRGAAGSAGRTAR